MSSEVKPAGSFERQFIHFSLGDGHYGIPIEHVSEILKMESITEVPKAPKYIEGVINLRGNVVPIIDLRKRFGMPEIEYTKKNKIIIIDFRKRLIGLIVDMVSEVITLNEKEVEPSLPTIGGLKAEFISGIGKINDMLIIIIEIHRIISSGENITVNEHIEL